MENLLTILEIQKSLKRLEISGSWIRWEKRAERNLTHKLRELFKITFDRTILKLQKMITVPSNDMQRKQLLFEIDSLREKFKQIINVAAVESVNIGRQRTVSLVDSTVAKKSMFFENLIVKQAVVEVSFTQFSKQFEKLIRESVFVASEATMDRMIGDVMENLADSYVKGLGVGETAERLKAVFGSMEKYRLQRIARTEVLSYQNLGSHHTCIDLGVQYEQWWSASDLRVRESHNYLHGQIVKTGDKFSNGLRYPGDRSGPIEEWIQCRCRVVPFLMPWGYMAPIGVPYFYETDLVESGLVEPEKIFYDLDTYHNEKTLEAQDEYIKKWSKWLDMPEKEIRKKVDQMMAQTLKDGRCAINITSKNFQKVLEDGRFKSQFETQTSSGYLGNGRRSDAENKLFGIQSNIDDSSRSIYGYIAPGEYNLFQSTEQYGEITCILDKAKVIDRTTYCYGDSLRRIDAVVPAPLANPIHSSADMYTIEVVESFLEDHDDIGLITINTGESPFMQYVEAHYHGGLKIDDVSEIYINVKQTIVGRFPFEARAQIWIDSHKDFVLNLKNNGITTYLHDGLEMIKKLF